MVELFFHLASKWPKWCAQTMHPFSQIATIFPRIGAPIVAVSALVGLVTLTFDFEGHGTCKNRARDPPLGAVILVKFHFSVFAAVTPTL